MYAQNNEDDFYAEYLDLSKKDGRYLDIGAGRAHDISNTRMLYELGWQGLCIDANPEYVEEWAQLRPKDIFLTQAIVDKPGPVTVANTVIEGSWLYEEFYKKRYKTFQVPGITLMQLLGIYPDFYNVDLFSLDVELSEAKVLATADFSKFTPKLIIMEKCVRSVDSKPLWEHLLLPHYQPIREFSGNRS